MSDETSNGLNDYAPARLRKLLAYHEEAAAAIRKTIELLNGQRVSSVQDRASTTLLGALQIEQARRAGRPGRRPGRPRKQQPSPEEPFKSKKQLARERAFAYLARFDHDEPRPAPPGVGKYLANGYLRKKDGGYIRTAKPYET